MITNKDQYIKTFLHIDLDAFYASVEQLDFPEYRGKPVIVGSLPEDKRGVVSTCSYEARRYGVHSAMPIYKAYQLCPQAIFLRGRMHRYQEKSKEVMSLFQNFTPSVQQISIDEAFLDISGSEKLFGKPAALAQKIKNTVFEKTGLSVSVGIAHTKYLAKIASGMSKPDGLYEIAYGKEEAFMLELPLKKVWGIGEKSLQRLQEAGFFTTVQVHSASMQLLQSLFGKSQGEFLWKVVRGIEAERFDERVAHKSLSEEQTFEIDIRDKNTIEKILLDLSQNIFFRLLHSNLQSKTVQLKIRYSDFTTVSIQETHERIIATSDALFEIAKRLFYKKYEKDRYLRLLGLGFANVKEGKEEAQQELFAFENEKKKKLEKAIVDLQKKDPSVIIKKARIL